MALGKLSKRLVENSFEKTDWDFGNSVLYKLCDTYPHHKKIDQIVGKIWIIGRSYAAAIERRKKSKGDNDSFYTKTVGPTIQRSGIDEWIEELEGFRFPNLDNIEYILEVHYKLLTLFKKITDLEKRSLASKYLHFHKPNLFFIYDSRAVESIRKLTPPTKLKIKDSTHIDVEYAKFCMRCINLRDEIKERFEIHLSPRKLDKLLLAVEE